VIKKIRPASAFAKYLSRWRHGHGFGVHSPWAYRVITEVIGEHAKYYAYPEINELFGTRRKTARTVYRLLLHLKPSRVDVVGDARWCHLASLTGTMHSDGSPVLIVDNPAQYTSCGDAETVIFTCLGTTDGRNLWRQIMANLSTGMAIDSHRKIGIICFRRGLPRQTIHARF
jgi:hypothetical protein